MPHTTAGVVTNWYRACFSEGRSATRPEHPLPENVYDVYMKYLAGVALPVEG